MMINQTNRQLVQGLSEVVELEVVAGTSGKTALKMNSPENRVAILGRRK